MKIGDRISTPRFLTVQINEILSPQDARDRGYTEPTHYEDDEYDIFGKVYKPNHMVFAAVQKGVLNGDGLFFGPDAAEVGKCPLCGTIITDYGGIEVLDGGIVAHPFKCKTCGATGKEQATLSYDGYYGVRSPAKPAENTIYAPGIPQGKAQG